MEKRKEFEEFIKSPEGYVRHLGPYKVYRVPGGIILSKSEKEYHSGNVSLIRTDTYIPFPSSILLENLKNL